MELERLPDSDKVNVITETFAEELLLTESTTFPVVITRGVMVAANKLGLLRKRERNFQPHGHELPVDGLSGLRDAGVVLGNFGRIIRGDEAPLATEMSRQIEDFLA